MKVRLPCPAVTRAEEHGEHRFRYSTDSGSDAYVCPGFPGSASTTS